VAVNIDIERMWNKFRYFVLEKTAEFIPKVNSFNIMEERFLVKTTW